MLGSLIYIYIYIFKFFQKIILLSLNTLWWCLSPPFSKSLFSFATSSHDARSFLIIKFQIETMVFKKCGICGVHNFRNKTVIIFDVSKRQFRDGRTFKYLCERHFKPSDTYCYSDGRKRLVGYSMYSTILVL